jgi:RNA polymerase sigma-70 factor (ECF subfamily)
MSVSEADVIAIYRTTIDTLYGYVSRRCGGQRAVAEDITQEVWLRAVRTWQRNGIPDNPIGWLTTVARNLLLNDARRAPALPIDEVPAKELLNAVECDAIGDDPSKVSLIVDAMSRMPEHESRLLDEFHFQRCRVAQLAAAYGVSERAIEGRLRRARERLRGVIERMLPEARDTTTFSKTGEST